MAFALTSLPLNVYDTNDEGFRLWGKTFTDMMSALDGITQVYSDIDWTTILMPTSVGVWAGKRVYSLDDALSSESPVYIALEFGRGNATPGYYSFAIRLTVGTTHDGSGVVSNYVMQQYLTTASTISDGGVLYGVRSDYGFSIFTNINAGTSTFQCGFSVERLREEGEASPDGIVLMYSGQAVDSTSATSMSPKFRIANYKGGQVWSAIGGQSNLNSNKYFFNFQTIPQGSDSSYAGKAPGITMDTFGPYDPFGHFIIVPKAVYPQATEFTAVINGESGTYRTPVTGFCADNAGITHTISLVALRVA